MPMNRADFFKSLQDGLNATFGLQWEAHTPYWNRLADDASSKKAYEEDVLYVGLGAAQRKAEGGPVARDRGREGWVARYYHDTWALSFDITEEALEDNLYGDLGAKYSKELARGLQHTSEINAHATYNNGFSSSYPIGDGQPFFSESHPLSGGGTLSNTLATPADLSETSLEAALVQMGQWTNDRGIPEVISLQRLIVHTSNQFNAQRIMMSPHRTLGADSFSTQPNDINVLAKTNAVGDWLHSPYITDPDSWFIKTDCADGVKRFTRKTVQRGMEGEFESGNLRYKARERYSDGVTNPRGGFGSAGAG